MTSTGVVAVWSGEEGWGVVESPDTPGGCWVHVGMLWAITLPPTREHETVHITGSSVDLVVGETVDFEWEQIPQDGYNYRAISVRPRRDGPTRACRSKPPVRSVHSTIDSGRSQVGGSYPSGFRVGGEPSFRAFAHCSPASRPTVACGDRDGRRAG